MRKTNEAKKATSRKARAIFLATVMPFAGLTAATSVLVGCPNPTTSTKEPTYLKDFQAGDTKIPVYLENGTSEGNLITRLDNIWKYYLIVNDIDEEFISKVSKIVITANDSSVSYSNKTLKIAGNSEDFDIIVCIRESILVTQG